MLKYIIVLLFLMLSITLAIPQGSDTESESSDTESQLRIIQPESSDIQPESSDIQPESSDIQPESSDIQFNLSQNPCEKIGYSIFSYLVNAFGDSPNTTTEIIHTFSDEYAQNSSANSINELDYKLIKMEFSSRYLGIPIIQNKRNSSELESRQVKNRRSAKRSRDRKKTVFELLIERVYKLQNECKCLKNENDNLKETGFFLFDGDK